MQIIFIYAGAPFRKGIKKAVNFIQQLLLKCERQARFELVTLSLGS